MIPTLPRSGVVHSRSISRASTATRLPAAITPLFELPIGILRVLQIPQWAGAPHNGKLFEIVFGRWRCRSPFESPPIPRIVAGGFTRSGRTNHVPDEAEDTRNLEKDS